MTIRIDRALEAFRDIIGVREAGSLRGLRRRVAALAAAADEVNMVLRREPGLFQLLREVGVERHIRIGLPGDQHSLLSDGHKVRHANELPFHICPDIDKLRVGILLQGFPDLLRRHILDHGKNSGCTRIAMTELYHGTRWQEDLAASIGRTPLIQLRGASEATGCKILGKAEFMNPGGSVKDRAGLYIIPDAEKRGVLKPGRH